MPDEHVTWFNRFIAHFFEYLTKISEDGQKNIDQQVVYSRERSMFIIVYVSLCWKNKSKVRLTVSLELVNAAAAIAR